MPNPFVKTYGSSLPIVAFLANPRFIGYPVPLPIKSPGNPNGRLDPLAFEMKKCDPFEYFGHRIELLHENKVAVVFKKKIIHFSLRFDVMENRGGFTPCIGELSALKQKKNQIDPQSGKKERTEKLAPAITERVEGNENILSNERHLGPCQSQQNRQRIKEGEHIFPGIKSVKDAVVDARLQSMRVLQKIDKDHGQTQAEK